MKYVSILLLKHGLIVVFLWEDCTVYIRGRNESYKDLFKALKLENYIFKLFTLQGEQSWLHYLFMGGAGR